MRGVARRQLGAAPLTEAERCAGPREPVTTGVTNEIRHDRSYGNRALKLLYGKKAGSGWLRPKRRPAALPDRPMLPVQRISLENRHRGVLSSESH